MEKNKPVAVSNKHRSVSKALREAAESGSARVKADDVTDKESIRIYCLNLMREIGAKASVKRVGDYYEITRTA